MKRTLICFLFICASAGAAAYTPPEEFVYKEIPSGVFTLASWQKITDQAKPFKIYIEGDGRSFKRGRPTQDPTPKNTMFRRLAFGDTSANVIYLARPCQFVKDPNCAVRHWTTARFAPEVINSLHSAVKQTAGEREVILIGYSGGAQAAGLIAAAKPGLSVTKIITLAGNLDHEAWTRAKNLPPLNESLNLSSYRKQFLQIPQRHYAGGRDKIIPPALITDFAGAENVYVVPKASHGKGFEKIFPLIWQE